MASARHGRGLETRDRTRSNQGRRNSGEKGSRAGIGDGSETVRHGPCGISAAPPARKADRGRRRGGASQPGQDSPAVVARPPPVRRQEGYSDGALARLDRRLALGRPRFHARRVVTLRRRAIRRTSSRGAVSAAKPAPTPSAAAAILAGRGGRNSAFDGRRLTILRLSPVAGDRHASRDWARANAAPASTPASRPSGALPAAIATAPATNGLVHRMHGADPGDPAFSLDVLEQRSIEV